MTAASNTAEEKHNINITANEKSYTLTGEIVSTQAISSKTRTVETVTVSLNTDRYCLLLFISIMKQNGILFLNSTKPKKMV